MMMSHENLPVGVPHRVDSLPAYGVREHLAVIFRHKRKILAIVLIAILVAGPGSFLMTNLYSAEVRLLIQSSRTPFSMSTPLTGQVFTPAELNQKDDVATEVQIFTSQVLLDKLVDQFGTERVLIGMRGRWDWLLDLPTVFIREVVESKPVAWLLTELGYPPKPENLHYQAVQKLRAGLNVEGVRQTHVFTAALDAPNPEFAAEALNALVDLYLDHHLAVRKGKGSHEFFEEQTSQIRNDLRDAERRLQAFKDRWNIVLIEDQKRASLQQVTQLEAALREERVRPRREELSNRLKTYRDTLNMLDQREVELRGLMREVKVKQEALDLYLKKGEESRINEVLDRKGISNVTTIEQASIPQKPVRPRKFLNFVIGLLIGLLGGFGSAYVSEYFRRSFATREEAQRTLKQPVTALPLVRPETSDAKMFSVELRHAAQRIFRSYHERGLRTILVTSTLPGEGRSHVAAELAGALSELKFRVLLMTTGDVEQRGSVSVNQVGGASRGPQVANRDIGEVSESTDRPHLSRLRIQNSGGPALDFAERLAEIAKTMRDRFDLIVLDGPPLPSFPEMRVIVAAFDGTLLVVEAERPTGAAAARTLEAIEDAGGQVLGVVLNKCRYIIPNWLYDKWVGSAGRK
jgi:uncharacterized protein involved in exopolysaccharide biosynthesis/Mrp family chromosome partitioning ATPase